MVLEFFTFSRFIPSKKTMTRWCHLLTRLANILFCSMKIKCYSSGFQ